MCPQRRPSHASASPQAAAVSRPRLDSLPCPGPRSRHGCGQATRRRVQERVCCMLVTHTADSAARRVNHPDYPGAGLVHVLRGMPRRTVSHTVAACAHVAWPQSYVPSLGTFQTRPWTPACPQLTTRRSMVPASSNHDWPSLPARAGVVAHLAGSCSSLATGDAKGHEGRLCGSAAQAARGACGSLSWRLTKQDCGRADARRCVGCKTRRQRRLSQHDQTRQRSPDATMQ